MKPYNKSFVFQEIKRYSDLINQGTCGDYKIVKDTILKQELQGYMYENEEEYDIDIVQLYKNGNDLMKLTPEMVESSYWAISFAHGKVGVIGLGIGYVVQEIARKDSVEEVIVYEISEEIIKLYNDNFPKNEKIRIIKGDAFKAPKTNLISSM